MRTYRTYRTRQNVRVQMFDEQEDGVWEAVKPAVYFVLGFLVAYGLAVGLML